MEFSEDKSVVVILAAGIGSRMKSITDVTSKCIIDIGGTTPLEHTLSSFSKLGVKEAIIVVGHKYEKVIEHIQNSNKHGMNNITYVMNNKYNYHGCEYSLALTSNHIGDYETVYITEGDLLLDSNYIKIVVDSRSNCESAILLRDTEYIDPTRSVVGINTKGIINKVNKFIYDSDHINVFNFLANDYKVVGESLQLWRFSRYHKVLLQRALQKYLEKADNSEEACEQAGLASINKVIETNYMDVVYVAGNNWLNLNTVIDIAKSRSLDWINRD